MKIQTNFYTLVAYTNLLHIEAYSAWDDKVAAGIFKHIVQLKEQFYKDKAWAVLTDCRQWGLQTPEAESLLSGASVNPSEITLTHHAVVIGKSEIKKWQLYKVFSAIGSITTEDFEDIQEAKEWLESFGYHMTPLK